MKKVSKKNLVFHWRVHPNLMKKASKMAIFKELVGTFSFFGPKKSGRSPFCAWDFMSGIRTFRAGGTETTGWHPLLQSLSTACDFAHCLTVEVPNSMHPGGEKPAFRSERSAANNNQTQLVQQAKTPRLRLKGEGIDSKGLIWSSPHYQLVMIVPPRMDIPSYKAVVDNVLHDVC